MLRPFLCAQRHLLCLAARLGVSNYADAGPPGYDFRGTCPLHFPHLIPIPESVYPLVTYVLWRCDFTFAQATSLIIPRYRRSFPKCSPPSTTYAARHRSDEIAPRSQIATRRKITFVAGERNVTMKTMLPLVAACALLV